MIEIAAKKNAVRMRMRGLFMGGSSRLVGSTGRRTHHRKNRFPDYLNPLRPTYRSLIKALFSSEPIEDARTPKLTGPEGPAGYAELVVRTPGEGLRHVVLQQPSTTLGAEPACDVVLESPFVSRKHARIDQVADDYFIIDTKSRNGVLLNDAAIEPESRVQMESGDRIDILPFRITFMHGAHEPGRGTRPLPESLAVKDNDPRPIAAGLRVDVSAREVFLNSKRLDVRLSRHEFALLAFLYDRRGTVCKREEIGEAVWGVVVVGTRALPQNDDNMLHALVHNLKRKLERGGVEPNTHIISIPGVGYRLDAIPQS
jgi:pSer/pThr/pTyr-binding forkhead associated (FHA) protein